MAAGRHRRTQLVPRPGVDDSPARRHGGIGGVAIFDLDRTLLRGSSLVALGRAMAATGLVSRRRLARAALQDARFRRRGATDQEVDALRAEALSHVAGIPRAELTGLAQEVAAVLVTDMSPAARFLVDRHRAAGDFVVVLSASPQELVEAVVSGIGAHRGVGTRAEVVDGAYTGRLDGPLCYGAAKLDRLTADVGRVELGSATAYADSASDLPMLRACGRPVAVNPDRRLRAVAEAERWPVLFLH
jgi:HAD superfamily hydrolase (TIGR01490 family)